MSYQSKNTWGLGRIPHVGVEEGDVPQKQGSKKICDLFYEEKKLFIELSETYAINNVPNLLQFGAIYSNQLEIWSSMTSCWLLSLKSLLAYLSPCPNKIITIFQSVNLYFENGNKRFQIHLSVYMSYLTNFINIIVQSTLNIICKHIFMLEIIRIIYLNIKYI